MSPTFTDKVTHVCCLRRVSDHLKCQDLVVAYEAWSQMKVVVDCTGSQSTNSLKWSIHPAGSKKVMIRFLADFTTNPDQAYDSINEFIIRKFNPLVVVNFRFISVFLHAL